MGATAVVFDFDGVIVDSEGLHLRAFQMAIADRGWTLTKADYYARFLGFSDRDLFDLFALVQGQKLSPAEIDGLVEAKGQAFAELIRAGAVLCPGADACIRRLEAVYPLAIASAAFSHEIVQALEGAGLRQCFRAIVGVDDVAQSKPSPEPYLEAASRLGIASAQCVAIEDSPWGLESARAAGLKAIGVTHTYPTDRLTQADIVIDSLDEVTESFVRELFSR
jgi:beta-phosphoglucomutase